MHTSHAIAYRYILTTIKTTQTSASAYVTGSFHSWGFPAPQYPFTCVFLSEEYMKQESPDSGVSIHWLHSALNSSTPSAPSCSSYEALFQTFITTFPDLNLTWQKFIHE